MIFDGSQINLAIAFLGGIITFFASCLLPLVPTYLAYLSGIAITKPIDDSKKKLVHREVFLNSLTFVFGFVTVFVLLGTVASGIGKMMVFYRPLMQKIGGLLLIGMGLFMLGVIKPVWLYGEFRFRLANGQITKWRKLNSWLVGIIFGFAWTPCIGPVLAVILFWASQTATFWQGIGLLLAYGIGLGIPFLVVGLLFESLVPKLRSIVLVGRWLQKIAAVIIIISGLFLLVGKIEWVSVRLLQLFNLNTLAV